MEEELVSIIIPAYNVEAYIQKCIDSLLQQTYQNIEIIIINDGSKDRTQEIVDTYSKQDSRIKGVYISNGGVSNARNTGILQAKGNYIIFVDADDYVEKELVQALMDHRKIGTFSLCTYYRETIKKDKIHTEEVLWEEEEKQIVSKNKFLDLYEAGLINSPYCKLYERNILIKQQLLFDKEIALGEDLIFNLKYICFQEAFCFYNKPLYHYIKRQNESLSTKYRENMLDIQQIVANELITFGKKQLEWNEQQQKKIYQIGLGCLLSAVSNEYKNKRRNMVKNYQAARKMMKDKRIVEYIKLLQEKNMIEKREANLLLKQNYILYRIRKKLVRRG